MQIHNHPVPPTLSENFRIIRSQFTTNSCPPPLKFTGHTHPVYALEQVGSENANTVISVSTDGMLCTWSLSMLVYPQETLELKKGNREFGVRRMSIAPNETSTFYAGGEDGSIAQVTVHGSKTGVGDALEGHEAPVGFFLFRNISWYMYLHNINC